MDQYRRVTNGKIPIVDKEICRCLFGGYEGCGVGGESGGRAVSVIGGSAVQCA